MVVRALVILTLLAGLVVPAAAQERVTVGTQRLADNGALFLAVARGYFKAEGLDVEMTAYKSDKEVAQAVAAGAVDFGLAAYTTDAFNYAGQGFFKFVAAQVQERKGVEGNEVVASNAAWANGLRKMENLEGKSVAITYLGSPYHYQLAQIAKAKGFEFNDIIIKPMQTVGAAALAVADGKTEAAILPANYARELMVASQARLVGWYSEVGDAAAARRAVRGQQDAQRAPAGGREVRARLSSRRRRLYGDGPARPLRQAHRERSRRARSRR